MSKPLLIGLLVAFLLGIAGLVWWQSVTYGQSEEKVKKQLEEERQLRLRSQSFVPRSSVFVPPWV